MTVPPITWVIGAGGLLGGSVVREAARRGHDVLRKSVPWADVEAAQVALAGAASELVGSSAGRPWNIAWCAGAAVVGTNPTALAVEAQVFDRFLATLTLRLGPDDAARGALFLASSAGGVYAGSSGPPFTELTPPVAISAYGDAKLVAESRARAFSRSTRVRTLIGRISNLYGPGQDVRKPQGLVTHVCRAHVTGRPVSIYVPLDTLRDYLFVDDCAAMVVAGFDRLRAQDAAFEHPDVTKIMASHQATTVGAVLGECRRVFKRRPLVVLGASDVASLQPSDIRLRSVVWTELDRCARTPLPQGLSATAEDLRARQRDGGLLVG